MTKRPRDNLLQKLGHLGATCAVKPVKQKTSNSGFYICPKKINSCVICGSVLFIYVYHHNGITRRPRDNIIQESGIWVQHVSQKLENKKSPNSGFFIYGVVYPNALPAG